MVDCNILMMMSNPYRLILNAYRSRSGGQALIIILLVMSVSLLIGVGVSFRATSTLRQISFSEQSVRAYALAEAGVEDALMRIKDNPSQPCLGLTPPSLPCSSGDVPLGNGKFNYTIAALGASPVFSELSPIARDKTVQIDLAGPPVYPAGTPIKVSWVDTGKSVETDDDPAAMEVSIVYLEGGSYKLLRYAYDPLVTRRNNNKFFPAGSLSPGYDVGGVRYKYQVSQATPAGPGVTLLLLRLRALYNTVPNSFAVSAEVGNLPAQGVKITSTGYFGRAQRKVEAARSQPALSELFDFVLFSGSESVPLSK